MKKSLAKLKSSSEAPAHEGETDERARQVVGAIPPGARVPRHLIAKRTGLAAHVVEATIKTLVKEGRLRPVRVSSEGGQARWCYERILMTPADEVRAPVVDAVDQAFLATLSVNRLYEMYTLARIAGVTNPEMRVRASALIESGHLIVVKSMRGDRTVTRYRLARAALSDGGEVAVAADPVANNAPRASATDVFCAMEPNTGYRTSELAKTLGLGVRRTAGLLAVLQRDGRVVRIMGKQGRNPTPIFYVAGSEPSPPAPAPMAVATLWIDRPTFDDEYGRSLRSLREIAEATR